jgi:transcription termination/antitermination protein NusG
VGAAKKAEKNVEEPVEKRWFVVHTYSGFENKAKKSLEDKVKMEGLSELFGDIMIPMEQVVEMRDGQKRQTRRKLYPSYILVQMVMNDRTKHLVKNTPKVTGFLGAQGNDDPPPLTEKEVLRMTTQLSEGALKPKPRVHYDTGDTVRVIDGPFANFNGSIEEVNTEKGRVKVLVSIFGRSTPVDLDFMQIEKTTG